MALGTAFFSEAADIAGLQLEAMGTQRQWAGESEGWEESRLAVDMEGTLQRIERHRIEAAKASPSPEAQYEAYVAAALAAMRLQFHTPAEIISHMKRVTRRGVKNRLPPPSLIPRLLLIALREDEVRRRLGSALRGTSWYRHPPYNADIGGAGRSQHMAMTATDRQPVVASLHDLFRVDREMRGQILTLAPHQIECINRVVSDYRLTPPFSGSVHGERIVPAGVAWNGRQFTVQGGRGLYPSFAHRDNRGVDVQW